MLFVKQLLVLALAFVTFQGIQAEAVLIDPPNRAPLSSVDSQNNPENINDCGGFEVQYNRNNGSCGLCGDNFSDRAPRKHELGGSFGNGTVVRNLTRGKYEVVVVDLIENRRGRFSFAICNLDGKNETESEDCFKENNEIRLINKSGQLARTYDIEENLLGRLNITLILPVDLVCQHCVLRWEYVAGDREGLCEEGDTKLGCGNQLTYRSCADVTINQD